MSGQSQSHDDSGLLQILWGRYDILFDADVPPPPGVDTRHVPESRALNDEPARIRVLSLQGMVAGCYGDVMICGRTEDGRWFKNFGERAAVKMLLERLVSPGSHDDQDVLALRRRLHAVECLDAVPERMTAQEYADWMRKLVGLLLSRNEALTRAVRQMEKTAARHRDNAAAYSQCITGRDKEISRLRGALEEIRNRDKVENKRQEVVAPGPYAEIAGIALGAEPE